jgi:mRNA interferase MazF
MARYVPDAGDIVWLNFTPQAGYEQAGHRPALVLSPAAYNDKTSLMICCPMTTHIKNHPFEVLVVSAPANVVVADQVKSLDWRARKASGRARYPWMRWRTCARNFWRSLARSCGTTGAVGNLAVVVQN